MANWSSLAWRDISSRGVAAWYLDQQSSSTRGKRTPLSRQRLPSTSRITPQESAGTGGMGDHTTQWACLDH